MKASGRIAKGAWRSLLAAVAVAVVTWTTYSGLHVNSSTAAFSYLLLILALAARVGLAESIAASLASVLAYNYFFLPPVGTLTIADPENWIALMVFLITAITASQLSSSARRRALEAAAREREIYRLYEFSRALMLKDPERSLGSQAVRYLSELFEAREAWFYESLTDSVTGVLSPGSPVSADLLRQVSETGRSWSAANGSFTLVVPVDLGGRRLGSLAVTGPAAPSSVALQAIAQLTAIALESAHSQDVANRMEAARQNEQLKSTLLDALAHEFKTPLTSVKAATTSLLPRQDLDATTREMITIIDEEADRLNSLVSDSIELARIGSEPVTLQPSLWSAEELVRSVLSQLRMLVEDRVVDVRLTSDLPLLSLDRKLIELVLRQLVGNALKYSPPSSPVTISASPSDQSALIRIRNTGPGIPASEQQAIFEKFYRSHEIRRRVPGTGLGLAIAREIVEAHGGRIWVESSPGQGAEFLFTLPFQKTGGEILSS